MPLYQIAIFGIWIMLIQVFFCRPGSFHPHGDQQIPEGRPLDRQTAWRCDDSAWYQGINEQNKVVFRYGDGFR